MADTLKIDHIAVITRLGDAATDLESAAALREAELALRRIAKIKAHHHRYEKTTDSGTIVWPSIHGHIMHKLLYGEVS